MQKSISYITRIILFLLTLSIIIGTSCFEKYAVIERYNNLISYNNILYYFFSIILCVLFVIKFKYISNNNIIQYVFLIILSILISYIIMWFPADLNTDFLNLHLFATQQFNAFPDNSFSDNYFLTFPFQLNAATLFGFIYKITHSWRFVIIIGCLLCVTSSIFAALSIYNITHSRSISLNTLLISIIIICLNWRAYIPYTDNYAMIFPVLCFYIYTTPKLSKLSKLSLIIFFTGIGYTIKITSIIPSIAILIVELLSLTYQDFKGIRIHKLIVPCICLVSFTIPKIIHKINNFTPIPDKELQMPHYFCMGQNTTSFGTVNGNDYAFSLSYNTIKERNKACIQKGFQRIEERGLLNNIIFYEKKLIISCKDGLFTCPNIDNIITPPHNTFLNSFYMRGGRFFSIFAGVEQTIWNMILLLIFLSTFVTKHKCTTVLQISFIGVITYTLLFENRAKYLFMFLPIFVILSSLSLYYIRQFIKKRI